MKGSKGVQSIKRTIRKKKNNRTKNSVKKMIVMMSTPNSEQPSTSADNSNKLNTDDFLSTGRTGRRNALPDILNDHSLVSSSELPSQLEALTTKDSEIDPNKPSTSKEPDKI